MQITIIPLVSKRHLNLSSTNTASPFYNSKYILNPAQTRAKSHLNTFLLPTPLPANVSEPEAAGDCRLVDGIGSVLRVALEMAYKKVTLSGKTLEATGDGVASVLNGLIYSYEVLVNSEYDLSNFLAHGRREYSCDSWIIKFPKT
jgi:hypothetical protein